MRGMTRIMWDNRSGPESAGHTIRGLTQPESTRLIRRAALQSNPEETWAHVVGYEGRYEVSDHGRIRTVARRINRGVGTYPIKAKDKALYLDKAGYWRVSLSDNNRQRAYLVHRLVAAAFLGPGLDGQEVCHIDGDPGNATLSNLRWDSHAANELDKAAHGTQYNLNKESCPQGHPYAGENLYINPRGSRECRACRQARIRAFKAARKAVPAWLVAA